MFKMTAKTSRTLVYVFGAIILILVYVNYGNMKQRMAKVTEPETEGVPE